MTENKIKKMLSSRLEIKLKKTSMNDIPLWLNDEKVL